MQNQSTTQKKDLSRYFAARIPDEDYGGELMNTICITMDER